MTAERTAAEASATGRFVKVQIFSEDGVDRARIPLFGKYGAGKFMVVDAAVWRAGRAAGWPVGWVLVREHNSGREYVCTCNPTISQRGVAKPLARIIMNAAPREVISFRDGNPLNLRTSNLRRGSRLGGICHPHSEYSEVEEYVTAETLNASRPDTQNVAASELMPWDEQPPGSLSAT